MQDDAARQQPLTLATVKGYTGHQEAGAGVAGLMEALNLVSHAGIPPALHLRNLNPHVAATLQTRAVGIARGGPAPLGQIGASGGLVTGVSSFGAQGTNAHALVRGNAGSMMSARGRTNVMLQTSRCWVAPAFQVFKFASLVQTDMPLLPTFLRQHCTNVETGQSSILFHYTVAARGCIHCNGSIYQASIILLQ